MKIPLVDLNAQYLSIKDEIDAVIQNIIDESSFILGKHVEDFESELAKFCKCNHCIGVGSGSSALFLALKAHGIKQGDEVITVPNSFIATAEAIVQCGATPVFVDIEEDTMLIDPTKIEEKISEKTKAIIPVHLYGQICDMDPIIETAKKYDLIIIEDAAQAIGAEYKGRSLPIFETAIFSFFPAKNLGCFGDAGAVITNTKEIAENIKKLRDHGRTSKYKSDIIGYGERIDALQAAILKVKLRYLKEWTEKRIEKTKEYNNNLRDLPYVKTPVAREWSRYVSHMYILKAKNRDDLMEFLKSQDIFCSIHYPIPLHLQHSLSFLGYKVGDFPVAEKCVKEIISLPMYPELENKKIKFICQSILQFYQNDVQE